MFNRKRELRASRTSRQLRNPGIFTRTEQIGVFESNFKFQRLVYSLLIVSITAILLYICFFASFVRTSDYEISGNKNITNKEIATIVESQVERRLLGVLPRNSFFLFPSEAIQNELRTHYPLIDEIVIQKNFPRGVVITITEKEPVIIWKTNTKMYLVDILGRATSEITPEEALTIKLPIIIDEIDQQFAAREKIVTPQVVTFAKRINDLIPLRTTKKILEIRIPSAAASEIHVVTLDGVTIYFDPTRDADDQILILNDLLTKEIMKKKIQYIDLRIENWAYYK